MNHAGASFQNRVRPSEGWYNGLLGLLILACWPVSNLYILGLFLGIMAGADLIGLGFGLRRAR
jgi:hypothetical protein